MRMKQESERADEEESKFCEREKSPSLIYKESTFCLIASIKARPSATYENLTNFTSDELDEFVDIIKRQLGEIQLILYCF